MFKRLAWLFLVVATISIFVACSSDDERVSSTSQSAVASCKSPYDCCSERTDNCKLNYGDPMEKYLGFTAYSNGACTNGGSGIYQCTTFATSFFKTALHLDLGGLGNGGDFVDSALSSKYLNSEIFVFKADRQEPPRETDMLSFPEYVHYCTERDKDERCIKWDADWHETYGHVVVVSGVHRDVNGNVTTVDIIEQNVVPSVCAKKPIPSYGRTLRVDPKTFYVHGFNTELTATLKWTYAGIVRHNLAGFYSDVGWNGDGTTEAFRKKYTQYNGKLGWAFDNGGGPFVHKVRDVLVQDFVNTDSKNQFGTDGKTMLLYSSWNGINRTSLMKEGFRCVYAALKNTQGQSMGGIELLGVPTDDDHGAYILSNVNGSIVNGSGNQTCAEYRDGSNGAKSVKAYQPTERGCLWYRDDVDRTVHVHANDGAMISDAELARISALCNVSVLNNPPGPDCKDDCTPGTQQCLGSSQIQICGHPGPDSCYHWLTNSCASGTACVSNSCVSVTASTGGTTGAGGASPTGGSVSTGGSTPVGIQNCVHSARRCTSNPNTYDACIKDLDSGDTNWMTLDCSAGYVCTPSSGRCDTPIPIGSGGASSTGGTTSVVIATGGSPSFGGTSSVGGTTFVATGGAPIATGGVSSTGGMSAVGGAMSSGGTASVDNTLRFHYEGSVAGNYIVKAWWNTLTSADSWNTSLSSRGCIDTDISDKSFDCVLPVPSGKQDFLFQVDLPDGRFWGDMSYDPTGGQGATIGTVTITKGDVTYNYVMVSNGEGPLYMNGLLSVVP